MPEFRKREVAHKLKIGDILRGKPILEGERFNCLELGDKRVLRVNLIANVIDKYSQEGEKRFASLTLDDASGQIQAKTFGEDIKLFDNINQGNTVRVIGLLRIYNNQIYILPEIVKSIDPRNLLVRKHELDKQTPKQEIKVEEIKVVKDQILEMIKQEETNEGVDTEKLILEIKAPPDLINQEIKRLLEEGLIYEPRPGKLRYLGS